MKYNLFSESEFYGVYDFMTAVQKAEEVLSNLEPMSMGVEVKKLVDEDYNNIRVLKSKYASPYIHSPYRLFMSLVVDPRDEDYDERLDKLEEKIENLAEAYGPIVKVYGQDGHTLYEGNPIVNPHVYLAVLSLEDVGRGFGGVIEIPGMPDIEFNNSSHLQGILIIMNIWKLQNAS